MILSPTRPRIICLDFLDNRYHGTPHKELAELCSTTPRDGTTKCHRYCAAFVLVRSKPLIVAVTADCGDESRADAAERVLGRVVALPFDVACILADRGFYLEAALRRFHETAPAIVPVVRRGKRLAKALKTNISYWNESLEPAVDCPSLNVVPLGQLGLCDTVLIRDCRYQPFCRLLSLFVVESTLQLFDRDVVEMIK